MTQPEPITILTLALTLIAGCGEPSHSGTTRLPASASINTSSDETAIQAAVEAHVRSNVGINLAAMDMVFQSVSATGDQAQANVMFRLKQGGTSMLMTYFLQREPGAWIVLRSQPGGGEFSHPPMDQIHSGTPPTSAAPRPPGTAPSLDTLLKHIPTHPKPSPNTSPSP